MIPYNTLRACDSCGCVYTTRHANHCPSCKSSNNSRIEDTSD